MSKALNVIHANNELHASRPAAPRQRQSGPLRLVDQLLAWQERVRARRHLAELPDYLLKDIGVSRAVAQEEARKPFWKP